MSDTRIYECDCGARWQELAQAVSDLLAIAETPEQRDEYAYAAEWTHAIQRVRRALDEVSAWESPAEACPICRAHDAKRKAEDSELKAAAEADECKAQLQDARAVIQSVVNAIQPLAPFLLAHAKWNIPKDQPDE